MSPRRITVPEISADLIKRMDEENKADIKELKDGQMLVNAQLGKINTTLEIMAERITGYKDMERDYLQAKGVGKLAGVVLGVSEVGHWIFSIFKH